jgi:hypothetical protein
MIMYGFAFLFVILINVIPAFMPPTWIILSIFYHGFPGYDPLLLALVGAIASSIGRYGLLHLSIFSRRFIGKPRKKSLDAVKKVVDKNPVKAFFVTFLFALSPIPSNIYFITLGLAKSTSKEVFAGFFCGRLVSYYVLIVTANMLFQKIEEVISGTFEQLFFVDMAALILMVLCIAIDWNALFTRKKLRFI